MPRPMRPLWVLLALLPLAATELPEEPGNLDGAWKFRTDPAATGEADGWAKPDQRDDDWKTLTVPGHWEAQGITDPRPGKPAVPVTAPGRWTDYDGVAWYRRHVTLPAAWAGKELWLDLGMVDDVDRTFVNGTLVGTSGAGKPNPSTIWRGYKVPAALLHPGDNVIAVRVEDSGGPGGLIGPSLSLLPAGTGGLTMNLPTLERPLAERFAKPPARDRILKIIHNWPDEPDAQDALIRQLIGQGFGGVVCNVSFAEYLRSETKWQAFIRAVQQAHDAGFALWLYDEKGYPSGNAGGLTLQGHPEWASRGLLAADAVTTGGPVELASPPGRLVLAAAYPDAGQPVDLTAQVKDGKLAWTAPAGHWRVWLVTEGDLYEGTHAAVNLHEHTPYINLLMPEPTARFIALTHDAYAERLGKDLGKYFLATFTDEPSLMSLHFRPMPYRPLPFSPDLPAAFAKRHGGSLEAAVPALLMDAPGAAKARYDFWSTVGDLVSENFFGQIQTRCRQLNVPSGGHLLAEESLTGHVALYGDFMQCARRLDAPSIDCLTSVPAQVPFRIAKLIGSVADLEGRPTTMSETSDHSQRYRAPGDTRPIQPVSEEEIRGTCNKLILGGINTITSYYSFGGLSTEQIRRLNAWVGRCCTLLAGGHQVTDIGLVYPIESVWTRFTPARRGATDAPAATGIEATFNGAIDSLYNARRDFTFLDSRALAAATVDGGVLRCGPMSWRVVVLPAVDTLPAAAWDKLAAFWRGGGLVVALGARPRNSATAFPDPQVEALARELFGEGDDGGVRVSERGGAAVYLPAGAEGLLPMVLGAALEPDVAVGAPLSPLRVAHRRVDEHDVWFVINDGGAPCEETLTLAASGAGECYRPDTGEVTSLAGPTGIKLSLPPYGGALYRFAAARLPERRPVPAGGLPGLTVTDLPAATPTAGKGEFVRGGVAPGAQPGTWTADATLAKGGVDTFLFVTFDYGQTVDLRGADAVAIDLWVPEGQAAATQLLVMLHEQGGADYLASTGRSLGRSGHTRLYLPLSRFALAGWTKDANGRLDLDQITAIRVGWGGYFGQEGEQVAFSVAAPRMAKW